MSARSVAAAISAPRSRAVGSAAAMSRTRGVSGSRLRSARSAAERRRLGRPDGVDVGAGPRQAAPGDVDVEGGDVPVFVAALGDAEDLLGVCHGALTDTLPVLGARGGQVRGGHLVERAAQRVLGERHVPRQRGLRGGHPGAAASPSSRGWLTPTSKSQGPPP